MRINVSRLHHPVTALGPGRRAGIWVQGCGLACPGCVSRDTWDPHAGAVLTVEAVLEWLADLSQPLDGVTISGGEPTEQPEALHALCCGIDALRAAGRFDGDLLCYTGVELDEYLARVPWASSLVDAVITGRFEITEPTTLLWRGSANQRLIPLSERGRRVYAELADATTETPPMQFSVDDGQIWMIGIPRRGDLQLLEAAMRANGVTVKEVSWRPQ